MAARIIDGKGFAEGLRGHIAAGVSVLKREHGLTPGLAVILVGEDPASQVYVRNKSRQTAECGMHSVQIDLPESISQVELLTQIERLNADSAIHGILVQLPLPGHIDEQAVLAAINPAKDVDGFHPVNAGKLAIGQEALTPCTPYGCLLLLKDVLGDSLPGMEAVVIGRSNIVGKPMAQLLLQQSCTVTIVHSRTRDLPAHVKRADIVIAAVGRPRMVKGEWLKPGATVIDVGINRIEEGGASRLVGDVDFDSAAQVAGAITPVPGGVGPMTIACLLYNTMKAACLARGLPVPPVG